MLLEGLHLPLTTPFFADGRLNLRKLEANVAHYSLTPAAGLVVLGETGEASLLSDAETVEVLRAVARAAAPTKVLLAGIARDGVAGALALIEEAAGLGYDVAVVQLPVFAGITAKEQRLYLEAVADRTALPVLLAGEMPVEVAVSLAGHPKVLGWVHDFASGKLRAVLDATAGVTRSVEVTAVFAAVTGRMAAMREPEELISVASLTGGGVSASAKPRVKTRMKTVGFQVLASRTERLLDALEAGAVGAVLPLSAAAPQSCYEVFAAWKDGDGPLAAEKQMRLNKAGRRIERELAAGALKYACDLNGYAGGVPRLPLLPVTGEGRAEVERLMVDLRA